jgi:hypothetical protein
MRSLTAAVLAVLAVLAAVAIGLAAGRAARPAPSSVPPAVTATPSPAASATPVDAATLLRQPLSAGCATADAVWVVTNGGGLLRYDGSAWAQVDDTLRSLTHVACSTDRVYAVGLVGSFVRVDEQAHQINSDAITIDDLFGVSIVGDGALIVGSQGAVHIVANGNIQPYAQGISEDLRAVVAFTLRSAWTVGADGTTYRLDDRGWSLVRTPTTSTLRAIAARTAADPVAVGDAGTIVSYSPPDRSWKSVPSGVDVALRDVIVVPELWVAGDAGTLLTGTLASLQRVDLHTSCDLVSVFAAGLSGDIFVVGESAGAGGVWLLRRGAVAQHWGGC